MAHSVKCLCLPPLCHHQSIAVVIWKTCLFSFYSQKETLFCRFCSPELFRPNFWDWRPGPGLRTSSASPPPSPGTCLCSAGQWPCLRQDKVWDCLPPVEISPSQQIVSAWAWQHPYHCRSHQTLEIFSQLDCTDLPPLLHLGHWALKILSFIRWNRTFLCRIQSGRDLSK